MKIVLWLLVLALIVLALYLGNNHKIAIKFLPEQQERQSNALETDSSIHDAVNFVKKPL